MFALPPALVILGCTGAPDTAAAEDSAAASSAFQLARTHDGDWVDEAPDIVGPAFLRADGTVICPDCDQTGDWDTWEAAPPFVRNGVPAPRGDAFCRYDGLTGRPPCFLADGLTYADLTLTDREPFDYGVVPPGTDEVAVVIWGPEAPELVCARGAAPGCVGDPANFDRTGLDAALVSATLMAAASEAVYVVFADGLGVWAQGEAPIVYDIDAVALVEGFPVLALDGSGALWSLDSAADGPLATGVVAAGGQVWTTMWQAEDGTLWSTEGQGPTLPLPVTKMAGTASRGCALVEHDAWCWAAPNQTMPMPEYVTPS